MNKHTPGPWGVAIDGSGLPDSSKRRPDNDEPYREACRVHAGDPEQGTLDNVAHVYRGSTDNFSDALAEQMANARLIAAAPDLLAACKVALNNINTSHKAAREIVAAAITKAEATV